MGCSSSSARVAPITTLPPISSCLSNWSALFDDDNHINSCFKTLPTTLGKRQYSVVALKIMDMQGGDTFLSPTMRMQLWLAFSGVGAADISQNGSLWGSGWYDRALSIADEMSKQSTSTTTATTSTSSTTPTTPTITAPKIPWFDPNASSDAETSATLLIECAKSLKVVDNDVPRTLHNFARLTYPLSSDGDPARLPPDNGTEQKALRRVLRAFVATRPDINYTQGMNFVAALFLRILWFGGLQTESGNGYTDDNQNQDRRREELACGMLRKVANKMGMDNMWRVGFPLLNELSNQLMTTLEETSPKVKARLEKEGLPPSAYTTGWLVTLFTSGDKLAPSELLRWWDHLWIHFACDMSAGGGSDGSGGGTLWGTDDARKKGVERWLLQSMSNIMNCHSAKILKAKDTVTVMNEVRRGLSIQESRKFLFSGCIK
jgi:hypothetical protein